MRRHGAAWLSVPRKPPTVAAGLRLLRRSRRFDDAGTSSMSFVPSVSGHRKMNLFPTFSLNCAPWVAYRPHSTSTGEEIVPCLTLLTNEFGR